MGIYFFSHVQEAFDYNLKYFLIPFIFFFSSLTHHLNVGVLNAVSDVSETFLIPFQSFFPLFFLDQLFPSLYPPAHLSVLLQLFYHFFPLRLLLFVFLIQIVCYSSLWFSSVTQSCPILCDPLDCSMPGVPVHHQLPEPTQTLVHHVGDGIHS